MFDDVAPRYDVVNSLLTLGIDRLWRHHTIAAVGPGPGQLILDLAAGTGALSRPFYKAGATVIPVDLSAGMLAVGKAREPALPFVNADALALPFADASFDAVAVSFGLRNVVNVPAALEELRRVTTDGGRIVICEFSTPTSRGLARVYRRYLERTLPAVARLISSNPAAYDYLAESILNWPNQPRLAEQLASAGWQRATWKNLTGGVVALHCAYR